MGGYNKVLKRKNLFAIGIAIIAIGSLVACGTKKENVMESSKTELESTVEETKASLQAADTIVYGLSTSPSGVFNPLLTDSTYDDAVCSLVYTSLLKLDKEQGLEPYLAKEYKVSDDQKTIVFTLNDNLMWSDGEKLTSKDVAYTFTSLASKDYDGEYGSYVTKIKGLADYKEGKSDTLIGIETPDDKTIKIELDAPYGSALTNLGTMGIIPEHIWSKVAMNEWKTNSDLLSKPIGNGPYTLTSFSEGQEVKFEKNKDFFMGAPKTDNIIFKIVSEDTVSADLKNNTIDIAAVTNLKKEDIADLEKDGFKMYKHPNNLFQYMGLNYRKPVFKDLKVREAIITAIDRKNMVEKLIEGNGEVKDAPMLSSSWAYPKDVSFNKYEYNVEKAKSLLGEAGYTMKDGIMESVNGEKLSFSLDVPLGNSIREQAAQIIQQNLKEIGIEVELNKMEFPALMEKVVANHDFDMYMMGNNLTADPDLTAYWSKAAVSNEKGNMGWNISGFTTPELESMLEAGASTTDITARKAAYKDFATYMNEQIPWIYLFEQDITIATNPNLEGFEPSVFRDFSDAWNWTLMK